MRTAQPKPKKLTAAEVPADLREFFQEVAHLIDTGDEAALIESDDLLQCDRAYGGLIDEEDDIYAFTYFPREGVKTKWIFDLSAEQIRAIADEDVLTLELWACEDGNCGSMFQDANETCFYCDYVVDEVRPLPSGEFRTRRDWALAYFALHPDAHPLQMIGDYNQTESVNGLGSFSLNEARDIQEEFEGRGAP